MTEMVGSKWDEVLDELTESLRETLISITSKDIVRFCVENKITRRAAEDFLKKYRKICGKDSSVASLKKEKGNEKYKEKKYEESLHLYTESIFYCRKDDECLPLAYSNRSLVLQLTDHPSESLTDIDLALENGYPKTKADKLMLRRAKCLVQLGDVEKAREVLKEALENSEKKELHKLIQQELEEIKDLKCDKNINGKQLPELAGGENKNFVSASNYLSVNYDETKGRHVLATKNIAAGEVLFVEKPFAFVVLKNCLFVRKNLCENCCKETEAPIPCWNCLDVSYCSPKCRDEFWNSVHAFECGFSRLFESVGIAYLSVRIILKASSCLDELKKCLNNISKTEYEKGIVSYISKDYDSVYNLVHNSNKYKISDLFQYAMTALLLSLYLRKHTDYFPAGSDEADLILVTSVIWRHILQLICNGHAITRIYLDGRKGETVLNIGEVRIGTSIYTSASMMNHSCEPSIINSFHNNCLIVRAAKEIKKGEEVFNCYGPDARRMKRDVRQRALSEQYCFKCKCQACSEKFDIQDIFTAFKCAKCKGPSIPDKDVSQICVDCGRICDISNELRRKKNEFYSLIREGGYLRMDLRRRGGSMCDATETLQCFLEGFRLGKEIFYEFHEELSNAADEVARCYAILGDFERCILFLKFSIRYVEKRFGSSSVEFADEIKKLADAITNYVVSCEPNSLSFLSTRTAVRVAGELNSVRDIVREGIAYYETAERIINFLYGPDSEVLVDIKKNKGILKSC